MINKSSSLVVYLLCIFSLHLFYASQGFSQTVMDPFLGGIAQFDFDRGHVANDLVYEEDGDKKELSSVEARQLYYDKNDHLIQNDHFENANILNSNNRFQSLDQSDQLILDKDFYAEQVANANHQKGKQEIWNTSYLNPSLKDQQVWKGSSTVDMGKLEDARIHLYENSLAKVNFESISFFKAGHVAMSVSRLVNGKKEKYVYHFNLTVHNFLLNKMILRKMGYVVPGMKRLARSKVVFKSKEEKEYWKKIMQDHLSNAYDSWIAQENEYSLVLNDMVVTPEDNSRLNFAVDTISDLPLSIIKQNKRIYNALPLFWVLGNVPISIEQFSPIAGRVVGGYFFPDFNLDFITIDSDLATFNIHRDDAIWAIRKIAKLTEDDWDEIVDHSGFPQALHQALKGLLMARRDSLLTAFNFYIDAKKFNPNIRESMKGWEKETDENGYFPTYARKFNLKDPEPDFLTFSQMNNFILSRLMTKVIGEGVSQLNSNKYFTGNIKDRIGKIEDRVTEKINAYIDSNGTTDLKEIITPYRVPIAGGQLIFNREIALGNTLGTDNYVQLVDVIGANVYFGGMYGEMGRFKKWGNVYGYDRENDAILREIVPLDFSATARFSLSRTYAHVKPISNIKQAFKYPFRNAIVPWLMKSYGKNLKKSKKISSADDELENQQKINQMLKDLDEQMKDNESLIINDNINFDANVLGKIDFKKIGIKVNGGVASLVMRRIHLRKLSKSRFQVYHDSANLNSVSAALGVKLFFIPLFKTNIIKHLGRATVRFYNLDLSNPNDPTRKEKIRALATLLRRSSIRRIKKLKPIEIKYKKIKGFENRQQILVFRRNGVRQFNRISITSPQGEKLNFIRRYQGHSTGMDLQSFSEELLGQWVNKLFDEEQINIQVPFLNPGYSFMGRARNKISQYEAQLDQKQQVVKEVTKVTMAFNGWSMKAKKAEKIIEKLKTSFAYDFFPKDILFKTNKLFMYTIHFSLYIGHQGVHSLLNKNFTELDGIFKKYQRRKSLTFSGKDVLKFSGFRRLIRLREKLAKAIAKNNHKKRSFYLTEISRLLFNKLNVKGLAQALGSSENFLITSGIDGFRAGDESGDKLMSLFGNTYGGFAKEYLILDPHKLNWSLGSYGALNLVGGPLSEVLQSQNITPGEFYINWLQGRLM